jgi:hypothetical protein
MVIVTVPDASVSASEEQPSTPRPQPRERPSRRAPQRNMMMSIKQAAMPSSTQKNSEQFLQD